MLPIKGGYIEIITKEKEIQNDKERILKKFNFHTSLNQSNSNMSENKKMNNNIKDEIKNDLMVKQNKHNSDDISNKVKSQKNFIYYSFSRHNNKLYSIDKHLSRNKTPNLKHSPDLKGKKYISKTPISQCKTKENTIIIKSKRSNNHNNSNKTNISTNSNAKEHILKIINNNNNIHTNEKPVYKIRIPSCNSNSNSYETEKESHSNLIYDPNMNECVSTGFKQNKEPKKAKLSFNDNLIPAENADGSESSNKEEKKKKLLTSSYDDLTSKTKKDEKESVGINSNKKPKNITSDKNVREISQENSDNSININAERMTCSEKSLTEKKLCSPNCNEITPEIKVIDNLESKTNKNCLLSQRIVNDEIINYQLVNPYNEYRFITKIVEENNKLQRLNLQKFLGLTNFSIFNLLSFFYDEYDTTRLRVNSIIFSKINFSLDKIFIPILNTFKENYKTIFKLEKYKFQCTNFLFQRRSYPLFNLLIKVKIIANKYGQTYELGYTYKKQNNPKLMENIWKFDLKKKNSSPIWFSSEVEYYKGTPARFCFAQPIINFKEGDYLILTMNIFSQNGAIDPNSIQWKPLITEEAPKGFFQKSLIKCPYGFDKLRACEVENMVRFWRSENELIKTLEIIKDFKKIFGKLFTIDQIFFDFSKIYMFKILMVANKQGKLKKNKFCNFSLELVPSNNSVTYELQSIFLLNSNYIYDNVQLRVGMNVIFYIIDNKK